MLRKIYLRKIMVATMALVILLILYFMPGAKVEDYAIEKVSTEYIKTNNTQIIYLIDANGYVARTEILSTAKDEESKISTILNGLIIGGKLKYVIPNGFRAVIPAETKVLDFLVKDKILTINFSKEILNVKKEEEEKMIEALIFSLTEIPSVNKIQILVNGNSLEELPNSKKKLKEPLDRSFGINKTYDLTSTQNINEYTVYYVGKENETTYYVPVTKYVNAKELDKIKVVIDELSTSPIYEANLMSYLSSNVSLIDYSLENECLKLNFNDDIYTDDKKHLLEEVIYTISLSMKDNFSVNEVDFLVNNKEIYKNFLKSLE